MYVEADPSGADSWKLEPVVELLKEGAVGVIPTDTLYATAICLSRSVSYFKAVFDIIVLCIFIRVVTGEGWEAIVVNLYFRMLRLWVILTFEQVTCIMMSL